MSQEGLVNMLAAPSQWPPHMTCATWPKPKSKTNIRKKRVNKTK